MTKTRHKTNATPTRCKNQEMTKDEAQQFLTTTNAVLDQGLAAWQEDRTKHPHLTDAQFTHMFGQELVQEAENGNVTPTQLALSTVMAMHRITELQRELAAARRQP